MKRKQVNTLFACLIVFLGVVALWSMYENRNYPIIQDPPTAQAVSESKLPEGHPPIDSAANLPALEEMSQKDPQNAEYKTEIGNAYYDMGQYSKAIDAYQESLKLRPEDPRVETDLAACYHLIGEHDKALELLNRVLQYKPGYAQALYNKGVVLLIGKNDSSGGIAAWEDLLRLNPNFPQRADLEQRIRQLKAGG